MLFPISRFALAVSLIVGLYSSPAFGQVVQYATRNSFNAVTTNQVIEDFTGDQQALADTITLSPFTFVGLDFGTTDVKVEVIDGTNVGQPGNDVLTTNTATFMTDSIRIELPVGTTAFATDFKSSANSITAPPGVYSFTLFSGMTSLGTFSSSSLTGNSFSFVGFTSSSDITAVQIRSDTGGLLGGPSVVLDNVTLGTSTIPEPSTYLLLLCGALLLGQHYLRRSRTKHS